MFPDLTGNKSVCMALLFSENKTNLIQLKVWDGGELIKISYCFTDRMWFLLKKKEHVIRIETHFMMAMFCFNNFNSLMSYYYILLS